MRDSFPSQLMVFKITAVAWREVFVHTTSYNLLFLKAEDTPYTYTHLSYMHILLGSR